MSLHTEWLRRTGTDLRGFWSSEDGLVTVEWVALAGAIIIGAIAVGWLVMRSLPSGELDRKLNSGAYKLVNVSLVHLLA